MPPPRLLVVAHGTASPAGAATTRALVDAVRAARREIRVDLCFLDVIGPTLAESLDASPTVVVPLLLSTGFHVQSDIPAATAGHPATRVAAHLGPHPLVLDAVADRLAAARTQQPASTFLVAAGSSRLEARQELDAAARALGERLGRPVTVLTMADDLRAAFAAAPPPVEAAAYLLAEGRFTGVLAAAGRGLATVGAPLGVHPALVELVWRRYDEVAPD
ncbi:MAG: sirohydrochlorin chelatase [Jatrophihabitans sp.]|uniref:sirohydrochlorin chelatase n=1 Tax=Jatrophihabitans sp. TaxID=1932789 RepID=UPI003F7E1BC3